MVESAGPAGPAPAGGRAFAGEIRSGGPAGRPGRVTLLPEGAVLEAAGTPPVTLAYRDLVVLAVDGGVGLVVAGEGSGAARWLLERFGPALGPLVAALRDGRLRQRLADGLVQLPDDERFELVEAALPGEAAGGSFVAQLATHRWGLVLAPLDEQRPWIRLRRSGIGPVEPLEQAGGLHIRQADGGVAVDLLHLGGAATRHRARIEALRDGAALDAGRLVGALLADLPFGRRSRVARLLVDGRPVGPEELGDAFPAVETAVLGEPVFAESYAALVERAGGPAGTPRWLALAPEDPGSDVAKAWFFVALPGNLVAMEIVTSGAHATYCFRVVPPSRYGGGPPDVDVARAVVAELSGALVDLRFLREPIALPAARLATPAGLRYRLAIAALPSLAAARDRFVARLVHRDPESWGAALDDLVAWHGACRDDGAAWPGRAVQEAEIDEAAGVAPAVGIQRPVASDSGEAVASDMGEAVAPGGERPVAPDPST